MRATSSLKLSVSDVAVTRALASGRTSCFAHPFALFHEKRLYDTALRTKGIIPDIVVRDRPMVMQLVDGAADGNLGMVVLAAPARWRTILVVDRIPTVTIRALKIHYGRHHASV